MIFGKAHHHQPIQHALHHAAQRLHVDGAVGVKRPGIGGAGATMSCASRSRHVLINWR
jgi:hypothetical protein